MQSERSVHLHHLLVSESAVSHIQEIGDSGDAEGDARYAKSYNRQLIHATYRISNEHLSSIVFSRISAWHPESHV